MTHLFYLLIMLNSCTLPCVEMETNLGNIILEIDTVNAPVTATNFLNHVCKGSYNNAIFYRVVKMDNQQGSDIKIEVIQGGIFEDEAIDEYRPIPHETTQETGLKHRNGAISMARAQPGTASTEFFICIGDQPELDYGGRRNPDGQGFAAFGRVVKGMEVVRHIQQLPEEGQYLKKPVTILNAVIK